MKIYFLQVSVLLSFVFFFSCQKSYLDINPDVPDNFYISKIYEIDSTHFPEDTLLTHTFFYDNLKRVVRLTDSFPDPVNAQAYTYNFYYHGNERRPYRINSIHQNLIYNFFDTTDIFSFYDPMNRRIKDSTLTSVYAPAIPSYVVNLTTKKYSYSPGYAYAESRDTNIFMNNGAYSNAIKINDTAMVDAANNTNSCISNDGVLITRSEVFYTAHRNVFHNMNIFNKDVNFIDFDTYLLVSTGYNPFAIVSTLSGVGSVSRNITFDYAYDANGNVHEMVYEDDNTAMGYQKIIFEYVIL